MEELNPIGALKDPKDPKDILYQTVATVAAVDLPRKFSTRKDQSPVVKQKYGSCCGFARKSSCEYHRKRNLGIDEALSGRFYYEQSKQLDGMPDQEGTNPRITIAVSYGKGGVLEKDYNNNKPSNGTHTEYLVPPAENIIEGAIARVMTGGFVRVRNLQELKQAIVEYGEVEITVNVYTQFDNPESDGFIPWAAQRNNRGMHRIICCGYDDDFRGVGAIEIKNNWGESWGGNGYAWIAYNYEGDGATPCFDMWVDVPDSVVSAQLTNGAPIKIGYPVDTPTPFVTQGFGDRPEYYAKYGMKGHNGIDFRTRDTNKIIKACDDGEIMLAGADGSYGQAVRIKHAWGMSIYAHNSQITIPLYENDGSPKKVKRGDHLAIAGATGDTGTPPAEHCHFGIRINGVKNSGFFDWVDPTPYFGEQTMTKFYRVLQNGKAGLMILEGFSGTILFEDKLAEYQQLLKINGAENAPIIEVPAGKIFKINDHGKLGIMILEGFSGTILFENDWTEYQTLLQITAVPADAVTVQVP